MSPSFSNIYIFFALVVIGLWYFIKYLVHRAGYETHLFWGHGNDIQHLQQLIEKERDPRKKVRFQALLFAFYASFALGLFTFVITLIWFR